jgi:hypothetical protein
MNEASLKINHLRFSAFFHFKTILLQWLHGGSRTIESEKPRQGESREGDPRMGDQRLGKLLFALLRMSLIKYPKKMTPPDSNSIAHFLKKVNKIPMI